MDFILELLFPKKCVGCKKFGSYFCPDCVANIKQGELICPQCNKSAVGGQTHPLCRRKYGLEGLWSLGLYTDGLRTAIIQLKYKYVRDLSKILVDIIVIYWALFQPFLIDKIKRDPASWAIVPVPLHKRRKNWRGFNQSEALGQDLAKRLGLTYIEGLKRIRNTTPQVKLKRFERRKNLKDAFAITSPYNLVPNILLIDDVWTTGSTMKECSNELKRAGVKQIWALTLAR